jgi:predicted GTPase
MSRARERLLVLGAAGRDFHVSFRDDPSVEVVGFTAAQIPGIDDRCYPPALAGPLYPEGIPILDEDRLEDARAILQGRAGTTVGAPELAHWTPAS